MSIHMSIHKFMHMFIHMSTHMSTHMSMRRYVHSRVLQNAEEIAFYRGHDAERGILDEACALISRESMIPNNNV